MVFDEHGERLDEEDANTPDGVQLIQGDKGFGSEWGSDASANFYIIPTMELELPPPPPAQTEPPEPAEHDEEGGA